MLNKNKDAKRLIEAILFAADEPLDIETIKSKIELNVDILKILKELQSEFIERGINLYEISNKWSFRTAENLSKKIASEVVQQRKLSKATIETLAIIAYHQPVTRSEIEEIRGVSFSTGTLEILFELGWVKPQGRKEVPGKPLLYVTTDVTTVFLLMSTMWVTSASSSGDIVNINGASVGPFCVIAAKQGLLIENVVSVSLSKRPTISSPLISFKLTIVPVVFG